MSNTTEIQEVLRVNGDYLNNKGSCGNAIWEQLVKGDSLDYLLNEFCYNGTACNKCKLYSQLNKLR